jgi:hypothetical protein
MVRLKPDLREEGYRELEKPIRPKHAIIDGYNPATVVELLGSLWAYPFRPNDACKLREGNSARIMLCQTDEDVVDLVGLRYDFVIQMMGSDPPVRFLHGCDIMCYSGGNRRCILEMLQRDRCFISLDSMSLAESRKCLGQDDYEGLFLVHQLHGCQFPEWSEDGWKSFGCQARPHIQFQMP